MKNLPDAIYVWLVPSEEVQDQPGIWRIRKWDTEPFPEANFTMRHDGPNEPSKEVLIAMLAAWFEDETAMGCDHPEFLRRMSLAYKAMRPTATNCEGKNG